MGETLAKLFLESEKILIEHKPAAIFVLGDTNSALVSILARRLQIIVYHWEAGNRSFDANVPEEINRRIIDHSADFNIAYTENARRNLIHEGLEPRRIMVSGSPLPEVIKANLQKIQSSDVVSKHGLSKSQYVLASVHRQENVDSSDRLNKLLFSLDKLGATLGMPIVMSLHPRTKQRISQFQIHSKYHNLKFIEPQGYISFMRMQMDAYCVVSDSGTITEEAAILNFPAVTVRDSMERQEGLDTGSIVIGGLEFINILNGVKLSVESRPSRVPQDYLSNDASRSVMAFILSTVHLNRFWSGVRELT